MLSLYMIKVVTRIFEAIVGYVDSNYGEDLDGRRFLTKYVFTSCDSVISWKITLHGNHKSNEKNLFSLGVWLAI